MVTEYKKLIQNYNQKGYNNNMNLNQYDLISYKILNSLENYNFEIIFI